MLGHSGDVVVERGHLLQRLGRVESQELGELGSVGGILVDSELEVLSEGLVELGEVVLVLGDLGDHVESLLDNVLYSRQNAVVLASRRRGHIFKGFALTFRITFKILFC